VLVYVTVFVYLKKGGEGKEKKGKAKWGKIPDNTG
jgi:hypothetical protein